MASDLGADVLKSLDRKLAAIHANPSCREFILADAKDADMAFGIGAPGLSPESHPGEVRFKTLEEYRRQIRAIVQQGAVDIMLMSAHTNHALTIRERIFENSPVTPAARANDTPDVHIPRGGKQPARAPHPRGPALRRGACPAVPLGQPRSHPVRAPGLLARGAGHR